MFAAAKYTEDGHRVPRPTAPQLLYRGSVADRRADWSWTDSHDVTRTYATGGFGGRLPGAIWTALVEPERLLARNTGRGEFEYVVDNHRPRDHPGLRRHCPHRRYWLKIEPGA